jgi:RNase P/RNase MRP subunit p30
LRYYDVLFDSCRVSKQFASRLGFDDVFLVKKGASGPLCASSDASLLMKAVQRGATAIAITDFTIDRKLLAKAKDNDVALCMPFAPMLSRTGLERAKLVYRATTLLRYASGKRMEVSFASLAESELFANSRMQLVELAKLVGATDAQARHGICEVNKLIGESIGKG